MRSIAALAVLVVLGLTPSALGVTGVFGGAPADVRSAPWSVLVLHRSGAGGTLCSGSIIDPLHILTAAHCVTEDGSVLAAGSLVVRAGVTNAQTPTPTDDRQDRAVESIRVHRGYVDVDRAGGDDVAVLTLTAALDLGGPTAQAIALPGAGLRLAPGDPVTLAGFGLKVAGGTIDGSLNGMNSTLVDQNECLRPPDNRDNAVLLCAFSGSSSPCKGDSGSALVSMTPSPVVVGVARAASCSANSSASFTNVTAPEILEFVRGNDEPPAAPRPTSPPELTHPTAALQVGQTVRCGTGTWSGGPAFSYSFYEGATHQMLRSGPSPTYVLRTLDAGRMLLCRVTASNSGGSGYDESPKATPVRNAPEVFAPAATARPGGTAVLKVRLVDWARPLGAVTVCARLAPRVGGKACRIATPAGGAPEVSLSLPVKGSAPAVRARVQVTAQATDGRVARSSQYVFIRG